MSTEQLPDAQFGLPVGKGSADGSRSEAELGPVRSQWNPIEARKALLKGNAPDDMRVNGDLNLSETNITHLPKNLRCFKLNIDTCTYLQTIPSGLNCFELSARDLFITQLPSIEVGYKLDLSGCHNLTKLPDDLEVGTLILRGCTSLETLPRGITVNFLDVTSCTALTSLADVGEIRGGRLLARGCDRLEKLPSWLSTIGRLDVSECPLITALPAGIEITDWLDIGGSGITEVDDPDVSFRWRGVAVSRDVALHPETITYKQVMLEANLEVRHILLERFGYARFLAEAHAQELDNDVNPGGPRRLLKVKIKDDEPLVVLAVSCPSTERQYLLRVPPSMRTCHQAAAWIAGFDDPALYKPLFQT
jgi:hypothetical protein